MQLLAKTMLSSRAPIDHKAFDVSFNTWPQSCYVMWPALAATDARTSELAHGITEDALVAARFARNGWDPATFDIKRGYFVPDDEPAINQALYLNKTGHTGVAISLVNVLGSHTSANPTLAPGVAVGVLAYDPVVRANNNIGDWYQSGAALFVWWSYFTAAQQRPRTGNSTFISATNLASNSYFSFVNHAVAEDAAGSSSSSSTSSQWPRVVWMERDTLPLETRPPGVSAVIMIMNGWWMQKRMGANDSTSFGFPLPPWVIPIFISFHISDKSMLNQPSVVDYLKANGPIGSRDESTRDLLLSKGIDSYFSGCITPLLRLEDEGCVGFDRGHSKSSSSTCTVDAEWHDATAHFRQNPSNVLMTRNASWLPTTLNKYCSVFRWCRTMHTTRLHVWFPLHMNGYRATLYNKYTKTAVPRPRRNEVHPGVAIDGRRTNRFAGLLEAAGGEHQPYIDRLMRDVQFRIASVIEKANALVPAMEEDSIL